MRKTLETLAYLLKVKTISPFENTENILLIGNKITLGQGIFERGIVDRLVGLNSSNIVVIDPRRTSISSKALVHLAPLPESIHTVINGLLNLIIQSGYLNESFMNENPLAFQHLKKSVSKYTPQKVQKMSLVPTGMLIKTANIICNASSMVSAIFHGIVQEAQTAVQVNNLHLICGLTDRQKSAIYKVNSRLPVWPWNFKLN